MRETVTEMESLRMVMNVFTTGIVVQVFLLISLRDATECPRWSV